MRSGKKLKKKGYNSPIYLQLYFIGGLVLFLFVTMFFTDNFLKGVRKEVQAVPNLYSKFLETPDNMNLEQVIFQYFMEDIMTNINFPIIIADSTGTPSSWENIPIKRTSFEKLDKKDRRQLMKLAHKMEARGTIIPLRHGSDSERIIGYVYYGDSRTMTSLKRLPYYFTLIVGIFIILGIYGIFITKKSEQDHLWVGLAKETAHQFGTPISSLLGWRDLLEFEIADKYHDDNMLQKLDYMKNDITRLQKVASRFGKVGSILKMKPTKIQDILEETVDYFQERLPSMSNKIELKFYSELNDKIIKIDPELIKWTFENLIKNSIDAMHKKGGEITITAFHSGKFTHIRVKDSGIGLSKADSKQIFKPGVTSKERGWGLGLSLAKRIVEEYHHGRIKVLETEVGKGTTFEVKLPGH